MEASPWLDPRFLIAVIGLLVGAIFWLARLESKTNTNAKNHEDSEKDRLADKADAESDRIAMQLEAKVLEKDFYKHIADMKMHHNEEANLEFRKNLDRRLDEFDFQMKDIGRKLNHMAGRE